VFTFFCIEPVVPGIICYECSYVVVDSSRWQTRLSNIAEWRSYEVNLPMEDTLQNTKDELKSKVLC